MSVFCQTIGGVFLTIFYQKSKMATQFGKPPKMLGMPSPQNLGARPL
jgi:hypothetical protein